MTHGKQQLISRIEVCHTKPIELTFVFQRSTNIILPEIIVKSIYIKVFIE